MDKTLSRPSFFFLKNLYTTSLVFTGLFVQLQIKYSNIHGYAYLRAKEKWAEALGEKFLGLSCGLVPASKTQRSKLKRKPTCKQKIGFPISICSQNKAWQTSTNHWWLNYHRSEHKYVWQGKSFKCCVCYINKTYIQVNNVWSCLLPLNIEIQPILAWVK